MKQLFFLILYAITIGTFAQNKKALPPVSDKMMENAVIYEVNVRQYSPEGTFNAFAKDIPQLKKLGVKILWVMPIHPIGIEKRKEGLGSYYSIKDYRDINPEYGNLQDFKNLVNTAHANGIYVIIDWVANHTAWDHPWVKEHPDYYAKNKDGNIISPYDWTDVVKLNYDNAEMRKAMVSDMSYWIKTANIDGFRCDAAKEVPVDFWDTTFQQLEKIKPLFKLMEADQPELMVNSFDMGWGWDSHRMMNAIAQGKKTVKDWDENTKNLASKFAPDDILMNFTSSHDENSWNGSEYQRLGDGVEAFAVLTYMIKGMPLIYDGQEYDFKNTLKFFTKDQITHTKGKMFPIYEKLGVLKNTNSALNGGKEPASYTRLETSNDNHVLAFERAKSDKKVIYVANLSQETTHAIVPLEGTYTDYITGKKLTFTKDVKIDLTPWEYHILIK